MKRTKRLFALLLAMLLCLPLTGCQALETMRAEHAFWQEDGSILWNGNVYRALPETSAELNLTYDEDQPSVYVTAPDVPVLLSGMLGEGMDVYQDGVLLEGWTYYGDAYPLYCRSDRYEEITARIAEGFTLDYMFYTYSIYDEDGWYEEDATYKLTAEQQAAVMDVYASVIPVAMEEGMYLSSEYWINLYGASEDGLFKSWMFNIEAVGSTYYLTDDENMYLVPSDYNEVFAAILAPMIEEEKKYWDEGLYSETWEEEELEFAA